MNRKQRRAAAKFGKISGKPSGQAVGEGIPSAVAELLGAGVKHHQAGRLAEAEAYYRQVLEVHPDHAGAFHLLGIIAYQTGRTDACVELIGEAVKRDRRNPFYFSDLGNALQVLNRFDDAIAAYNKALVLKPDYAEAFYNRGSALQKLKRFEEALASYDRALALKPSYAEAFHNRGNILGELKRFEEALASYDRALELKPDHAEVFYNRAGALQALRRLEDALAACDKALALKPGFAEAMSSRGNALQALERYDEAIASYGKALALKPDYAETFYNCANALQKLKRFDEALVSYDKALALEPDYAEAFSNRGSALRGLNRFDEALASYERALELKPDFPEAFYDRGAALQDLNRLDEALICYEKALALQPSFAPAFSGLMWCVNNLCYWDRRALADDMLAHVVERRSIVVPFTLLGSSGDPSLHLQCAKNFAAGTFRSLPRPCWTGETWRHDKVRIAYLSADFRQHATAHLMAELFERHDRSRFEIIAVSFGARDESEMRRRLVAAFDRFVDVSGKSDAEAAMVLHNLRADIAIDLKGHTHDARPGILAYRPAPIQASYLGYPGTMGVPFIDYIIADKIVAPFEHQAFYTEKIVHLPDCYQVNDTKRTVAERTPTRPETGLPEKGFVFCCFNQNWKITPGVFGVWMRLLHAIDGSVLWLLHHNETAELNLRNEAQARRIDPARLVFAPRLPSEDHLARHRLADLFLDTLPYNAHTTASDALWVGLPVVTQLGEAFAGRVAASLLNAIGLQGLVTRDIADYEALALQLAKDPILLEDYRNRLNANRLTHPLFDTDRFRRHIETAYLQMWESWQCGEEPRSFGVESEGVCIPQ
jgi:protein O-GlcNAc transferase